MHRAAHVTEASLLSGTAKDSFASDATGGLLKEVGDLGILVMKDFTSMFTMNRDERGKALSALRHCYDGMWVRPVGADGARKLVWKGKLGVLGGVTRAIDHEHETISKLGERFLFYRYPKIRKKDALRQAHKVANSRGREAVMRRELNEAVGVFFERIDFTMTPAKLSKLGEDWLAELATLAACCRSYVARNSYNREIEDPGESEGPGRMMRALTQLWAGLLSIGVDQGRCRELLQKVALDCMPPSRRICFDYLAATGREATAGDIAKTCLYPQQTIRRALQDLQCHGVFERRKEGQSELWKIAVLWRDFCTRLNVRPEISESVQLGGVGGGRVSSVPEDHSGSE